MTSIERARQGLAASQGGFLRTRPAARKADEALRDIVEVATGTKDLGALGAARLGRAAAGPLAGCPAARLAVLRAALQKVEAGAVGTVGYQSQMAYSLLDAMDEAKVPKAERNASVRAILDGIAGFAAEQGLREADYARYSSEIGHLAQPVHALNMLDRVNCPEVGDVTRAAWFGTVAGSFCVGAEFDGDPARMQGLLALADRWLPEQARRQGDTTTLDHLRREERYQESLNLSPPGRQALHRATLRLVGDEVPCAPETALVLSYWALRMGGMEREEGRRVLAATFQEIRQAGLDPGSPAGRWLRFHDEVAGLGCGKRLADQLEHTAFLSIVEGRAPTASAFLPATIRYDLGEDDGAVASRLFDALERLDAPPGPERLADLALQMADAAGPQHPVAAKVFVNRAFEGLRDSAGSRPDLKTVLDLADAALLALPEDPDQVRRTALERVVNLKGDSDLQGLLRRAAPAPTPAEAIRAEDDFVLIGSVKVPRKALSPS